MLKPTRGRVLVAPVKEPKREGAIEIIGPDRNNVRRGKVLELGAPIVTDSGMTLPHVVEVGNVVLYSDRNNGTPVEGGLLLDVRELLAVEG